MLKVISKKDMFVGGVLFIIVAFCVFNVVAVSDETMDALVGGAECDCEDCKNDEGPIWHECDHTSMDPNVQTCSITDCLTNYEYWAECPDMAGGIDCPLTWDDNAIELIQDWKDGAPPECDGINQDEFTKKESTDCSPWGPITGRCEISSCGGELIDDPANPDVRRGRDVCDD